MMRPVVLLLALPLWGSSATASKPKTSTSSPAASTATTSSASEAETNGYDAVMCGINGYADGSGYSYSADAWNAEGEGFQCLSVINASSTTSAGFDATWHWPSHPPAVHSYPHVTFSSGHLPRPVQNLTSLRLAAEWTMSAGTIRKARVQSSATGVDTSGLNDLGAVANVAFDMFLDPDATNSTSAIAAQYEMMVWIGKVGDPYPLGYDEKNATCYTQQLGSYNFTLYSGQNARGTIVFTWVAPSDQTSFDEDIAPLFQYLWRNDLMSADAQLGVVEFGSEAYHSGNNVTFSASSFSMGVWPGVPARYEINAVGDGCKAPTSPTKEGVAARMAMMGGHAGAGMAMFAAGIAVAGNTGDAVGVFAFALGTAFFWCLSRI